MIKIKTAVFCVGIVLSINSYGQWLGNLPMQYNGGFAGETNSARVVTGANVSIRDWSKSYGYFASYDQFFKKLRSGIGVSVYQQHYKYQSFDNKTYRLTSNILTLSWSPKFSFKGKYTLAPFIDFKYANSKNNFGGNSTFQKSERTNLSGGFLINSKKFYAGLALSPSRIASGRYYTVANVQTGYTFQKLPESDFSFTPQALFSVIDSRGKDSLRTYSWQRFYVTLNLLFRYKKFVGSVNTESELFDGGESIGIGAGVQNKRIRLMLNENYTFGGGFQTAIIFRYLFEKPK